MSSSENAETFVTEMDDQQLIDFMKDESKSDSQKFKVVNEMYKRGINLPNYTNDSPNPSNNKFLPWFFAVIGGATLGRGLGAALGGSFGAGIFAIIIGVLGWYMGGFIARFAQKQKYFAIRFLIYALSMFIWFLICGVGMIIAQKM